MPAVLVQGVPDTHRVWAPLIQRLRRDDIVTRSLPGFGCGVPALVAVGIPQAEATIAAAHVAFPECSHWWQLARAANVAKELEAFWERA